jgi:hypothetical protein
MGFEGYRKNYESKIMIWDLKDIEKTMNLGNVL